MTKLLLLIALSGAAAGCASAQAKSPADRANLEVPPVPPRVLEALPVPAPPPEPAGDLPPVAALPARPRPTPPPASRETAKTDPKASDAPPVEPPAAPAPPAAAAPAPQLRTPGSVDGAEAARQVNDVIGRAKRTLGAINYQQLSSERRAQYDSARLMITQAEDAVKVSNFEFAKNLAEKADRLATEMKGR